MHRGMLAENGACGRVSSLRVSSSSVACGLGDMGAWRDWTMAGCEYHGGRSGSILHVCIPDNFAENFL